MTAELNNNNPGDNLPIPIPWQVRLEACLENPDDRERAQEMQIMSMEFVSTANLYGQVIIAEKDLPDSQKTVKPSFLLGGFAGGNKFVVGGLLFKFAKDVRLATGEYLYGGSAPNDEAAHKAAGHERKSLLEVLQFSVASGSRLRAPLITVVDYLGSRLTAQSLLPIGDTLVYGSNNGGGTIRTGEGSPLLEDIERLAKHLHLAPHRVTERGTGIVRTLLFPVDIEIHESLLDSSVGYVIDSARLFPPCAPAPQQMHSIFSQLFRKEFMVAQPLFLSSDCFSRFGALDAAENAAEVVKATQFLTEEWIPEVAQRMPLDVTQGMITRFLQQNGVNCRYLGLVRENVKKALAASPRSADKRARLERVLLKEMVARTMAKNIKSRWRSCSGASKLSCSLSALEVLNASVEHPLLVTDLKVKYGVDVTNEELRTLAPVPLLKRVGILCEMTLDLSAVERRELLTLSDISLQPRVKTIPLFTLVEAESLLIEAKARTGERRTQLLVRANELLEPPEVHQHESGGDEARVHLSRVLYALAKDRLHTPEFDKVAGKLSGILARLPDSTMDKAFWRARLARLRFKLALSKFLVDSAAESWKDVHAVLSVVRDPAEARWVLPAFAAKHQKLIKRALGGDDLEHFIDRVTTGSDYAASTSFGVLLDAALIKGFSGMTSIQAPKILGLSMAVLQERPSAVGLQQALDDWIVTQDVLRFRDLSYNVLDSHEFERLRRYLFTERNRERLRVRHVILEDALLHDGDLRTLFQSFSLVVSLTLDNCPHMSSSCIEGILAASSSLTTLQITNCAKVARLDLSQAGSLKTLSLVGCLSLLEVRPPLSMEEILIEECGNFEANGMLFALLGPQLRTLTLYVARYRDISSLAASKIETLSIVGPGVTGEEFPCIPNLRRLKISPHVSDSGLHRIVSLNPRIVSLSIPQCELLTDEGIDVAIGLLPDLSSLDVAPHPRFSSDALRTLKARGAKLKSLNVEKCWAVSPVETLSLLESEPERIDLMLPAPSLDLEGYHFTNVRNLTLSHCFEFSEQSWEALSSWLGPQVRVLVVSCVADCNDARLKRLLRGRTAVQELILEGIPARGSGLVESLKEGVWGEEMRTLSVRNCRFHEECLFRVLECVPNLRQLEIAGSSPSLLVQQNLWRLCPYLETLNLTDAASPQPRGLDKIASLRQLRLVASDFPDLSRLRLEFFATSHPHFGKDVLETICRCRTLSRLRCGAWIVDDPQFQKMLSNMPLTRCLLSPLSTVDVGRAADSLLRQLTIGHVGSLLAPPGSVLPPYSYDRSWIFSSSIRTSSPLAAPWIAPILKGILKEVTGRQKCGRTVFFVFCCDELSIWLLLDLIKRGHKVIAGVIPLEPWVPASKDVVDAVRSTFGPQDGVHWINFEVSSAPGLQRFVTDLCACLQQGGLDAALLCYPPCPFEDVSRRVNFPDLDLWSRFYRSLLFGPAVVAQAITSLIRPGGRMVFFNMEALLGGLHSNVRVVGLSSSSGLKFFIKQLALEMPEVTVFGLAQSLSHLATPGWEVRGGSLQNFSSARSLVDTIFAVPTSSSGTIVELESVPATSNTETNFGLLERKK